MANLAAILPSPKAPLQIQPVPLYTPASHEILIKNEIIAFNLIESKIAKLGAIPLDYPSILGSSFGGTIEEIGSSVMKYKVGERVVVSKRFGVKGNQYGAYQRYVVVEDRMICRIPEGMGLEVPASLMMNLTCVVGLFSGRLGLERPILDGSAPVEKDVKVLVYGGSSSFGSLSVQYLSQAGYKVTTTFSPKNRDFVAKLGATTLIDHTFESEKVVDKLVADGPYDFVVDTVSLPETITITSRVLSAQGGGKLYAMQPAFGPETLPEGVTRVFEPWSDSLYEDENRKFQEWVVQRYLPEGLSSGAIVSHPVEKVEGGLQAINGALERMLDGVSGVRLVADPWE